MSDFPLVPTTDIGTIESSPHRQEIFDKLLSGWSPARVARSIEKRHGIVIPVQDIAAFRETIPSELALKESELSKRLKHIDVEVDALLEMQRVLMLDRDRLNDALLRDEITRQPLEETTARHDVKQDTIVEHRAEIYFRHLRQYMETLHEIGEIRPPVIELEQRAKIPLVRQLVQEAIEGEHREVQ